MKKISVKIDFAPIVEFTTCENAKLVEHMCKLAVELSLARHFEQKERVESIAQRIEHDGVLVCAGIDPLTER